LIGFGNLMEGETEEEGGVQAVMGLGTILMGTIMTVYGATHRSRAGREIDELMREGKKKGFLTYSYHPATQTIYLGYKITF